MLIGEYRHNLDTKNRISLPAKFRSNMGETVVITRGIEECLSVYTQESWQKIFDKLENLSITKANERKFSRYMLSQAVEVSIDSHGRILVPDFLQESAGLGKTVVWTGVGDHAEMWSEESWDKYLNEIQSNPEDLAESLEGII